MSHPKKTKKAKKNKKTSQRKSRSYKKIGGADNDIEYLLDEVEQGRYSTTVSHPDNVSSRIDDNRQFLIQNYRDTILPASIYRIRLYQDQVMDKYHGVLATIENGDIDMPQEEFKQHILDNLTQIHNTRRIVKDTNRRIELLKRFNARFVIEDPYHSNLPVTPMN